MKQRLAQLLTFVALSIISFAGQPSRLLAQANDVQIVTVPSANAQAAIVGAAQSELTLSVSPAAATINVGERLTYTILLSNKGVITAENVILIDPLPIGLKAVEVVKYVSAGAFSSKIQASSSALTYTAVSLLPGGIVTITLPVEAENGLPDEVNLSNTANASASYGGALLTAHADASLTVRNPNPDADAEIQKQSSRGHAMVGETIEYTLGLVNRGGIALQNIRITDLLPDNLALSSAKIEMQDGIALTANATTRGIAVTVETLRVNGRITITYAALINPVTVNGTLLLNQAQVSADNDANPANNNAIATVSVINTTPTATPTVSQTPTATNTPTVTPTATTTPTFTPTPTRTLGPGTPTPVATRTLPRLPTSTPTSTTTPTYTPTPTFTATFTPSPTITATYPPPTIVVRIVTATPTATPVSISTDLIVSASVVPSMVTVGEMVTYTIIVTNTGNNPARQVDLVHVLPPTIRALRAQYKTYGSQYPNLKVETQQVIFHAAELAVNGFVEIQIPALVDGGSNAQLPSDGIASGRVTVNAENDEQLTNNSESADVLVNDPDLNPNLDVEIKKTMSAPIVNAGEQITFSVTIRNSGSATLQDVAGVDYLPQELKVVAGQLRSAGVQAPLLELKTDRATITASRLSVGGFLEAEIVTLVNAQLTNGATIVNGASVTAAHETAERTANNYSQASLSVLSTRPPEQRVFLPMIQR